MSKTCLASIAETKQLIPSTDSVLVHKDAVLIAVCEKLERIELKGGAPSEVELEVTRSLEEVLFNTPAYSLEGVKAKARILFAVHPNLGRDPVSDYSERLSAQILRNILALEGR